MIRFYLHFAVAHADDCGDYRSVPTRLITPPRLALPFATRCGRHRFRRGGLTYCRLCLRLSPATLPRAGAGGTPRRFAFMTFHSVLVCLTCTLFDTLFRRLSRFVVYLPNERIVIEPPPYHGGVSTCAYLYTVLCSPHTSTAGG